MADVYETRRLRSVGLVVYMQDVKTVLASRFVNEDFDLKGSKIERKAIIDENYFKVLWKKICSKYWRSEPVCITWVLHNSTINWDQYFFLLQKCALTLAAWKISGSIRSYVRNNEFIWKMLCIAPDSTYPSLAFYCWSELSVFLNLSFEMWAWEGPKGPENVWDGSPDSDPSRSSVCTRKVSQFGLESEPFEWLWFLDPSTRKWILMRGHDWPIRILLLFSRSWTFICWRNAAETDIVSRFGAVETNTGTTAVWVPLAVSSTSGMKASATTSASKTTSQSSYFVKMTNMSSTWWRLVWNWDLAVSCFPSGNLTLYRTHQFFKVHICHVRYNGQQLE